MRQQTKHALHTMQSAQLLTTVGVLLASTLLMGSKLIVTVPQGGAVVSATGLFACSAQESCTFVADEPLHGEVFTAISASDSQFSRWSNETGAVCPDQRGSSCSLAATESPDRYARTAKTLSMKPLFEKGTNKNTNRARFDVKSTHTAHFYEVDGATSQQIWQQLRSDANPLAIRQNSSSKPLAESNFSYRYTYQPVYDSNGQTCSVSSGEVQLEFNTTLPKLKAFEERRERERRQWLAFQAVIIKHEAGHQKIYRQLAREIPDALASIRQVPCDQLSKSVQIAVRRAAEIIKRESDNLDLNSTVGTHRSEKPLPSSASFTISAAGSQLASPVTS